MSSKPISVIPNYHFAITAKYLLATATRPLRLKVSVLAHSKTYDLTNVCDEQSDNVCATIKQFIQDHPDHFSSMHTTFVMSPTPEGYVAVVINEPTLQRINTL